MSSQCGILSFCGAKPNRVGAIVDASRSSQCWPPKWPNDCSDKEIRCIVIAMFDDDHRLIIMENHTFTFNVANVKA